MRRVPQFTSSSILRDSRVSLRSIRNKSLVIKSIPSIRVNFNNLFRDASYFAVASLKLWCPMTLTLQINKLIRSFCSFFLYNWDDDRCWNIRKIPGSFLYIIHFISRLTIESILFLRARVIACFYVIQDLLGTNYLITFNWTKMYYDSNHSELLKIVAYPHLAKFTFNLHIAKRNILQNFFNFWFYSNILYD